VYLFNLLFSYLIYIYIIFTLLYLVCKGVVLLIYYFE